MMLGKRARPSPPAAGVMKRNTSMTEFTLDFDGTTSAGGSTHRNAATGSAPSPRLHRRNSAEMGEVANFLRVCFMCQRRLIPGRDIYMYRGDSAFCSLECRQQQITQDERKEKFSLPSNKEVATSSATGGETVAAM